MVDSSELIKKIEELEAKLVIAREALELCESAFDECKDYPITHDAVIEALAALGDAQPAKKEGWPRRCDNCGTQCWCNGNDDTGCHDAWTQPDSAGVKPVACDRIYELEQDLRETADALVRKEFELQNIIERNRELELCIARHADEKYALNKEIATIKECLFQAQEAAKAECEANAKLELALQNCRLLAARHRKEDWALLILGFCAEGGVVGSVTREIVNPTGKESQAVCDSIFKDTYK